jgi:V8-like Glu-specific endopeptidase
MLWEAVQALSPTRRAAEVVEAPNHMQVMLSGYPSDKGGEQQWLSPGTVASSTYTLLRYTNDTFDASSGSPVYRDAERCGGPCVIGIHSKQTDYYNQGVRINNDVFDFLMRWKNTIFLPVVVR